MFNNLKRTNKTSLTNDELILFDVLFDKSCPIQALEGGESFERFFNYISHNLSLSQLKEVINKNLTKGLMSLYLNIDSLRNPKKLVTYIELTEKGGALWEEERNPNWDLYIIDLIDQEDAFLELSVFSPSQKTAENFVSVAHESKLYELKNPSKINYDRIKGSEFKFIPWKIFPRLYRIRSILSADTFEESNTKINWKLYEDKGNWWRNTEELIP